MPISFFTKFFKIGRRAKSVQSSATLNADIDNKFIAAIEQASANIVITDIQGNIEFVNKSFESNTGYTKEEVLGKNPKILNSGNQSKEFYANLWKRILAGKEWHGEFLNKRKNGSLYWEDARISPVFDKKKRIVNFVAVKEDISIKKELKRKLIDRSRYLKDILDSLTFPFYVVSANDCKLKLANKASGNVFPDKSNCYEIYGLNKPCFDDPMMCPLQKVAMSKKPACIEKRIPGPNGKEIILEMHCFPLKDEEGQITQVIEYSYDITMRKKMEEELKIYREELEKVIEQRTSEYIEAKEKAEESNRLKNAFLSNISHEIRTPMNAIIGFTQFLAKDDLSKEKRDSYIKFVSDSGNELMRLLNDLIEISRIESGMMDLKAQKVNLITVLDSCYSYVQETKEAQGKDSIKIIKENLLQTEEFYLHTDPLRLKQVLNHLCDNAIKFTEQGFIKIGLKKFEVNKVCFYVQDSGIGIAEEQKEMIFGNFNKAADNESQLYRGAGLGLSISKKLIEMLQGEISFHTVVGQGTTFNICFAIPEA